VLTSRVSPRSGQSKQRRLLKARTRQSAEHSRLRGVGRPQIIHTWTRWAAPVLLVSFLVLGILLAILRHESFETHLFDLGYYTQVIWNTARGQWFATTLKPKPPTFLADHFSPLLAVLAPLFCVAPDARTLLAVQIAALVTAILPAYIILRSRYPILAPLLVLAFVLNPFLHQTANEEFHEIMLAIPLLALATYALYTAKDRLLFVSLLLTLLVREDMTVYVASFGLYLLVFRRRSWKRGLFLIGVSLVWLLVTTGIVIPALGNGSYRYSHLLAPFGDSISEIILGVARDPLRLIRPALTMDKTLVFLRVFVPLLGIPLLAPGQQLLWAPALLLLLASPDPAIGTRRAWYLAPLVPLAWYSIAQVLARLRSRHATLSVSLLVLAALVSFRIWSPFPGGSRFQANLYAVTTHDRIGHRVLTNIPSAESVAAQSRLGAHLATREQIYLFPWYDHDAPPDLIALDATDSNPYPLTPSELKSALHELQMDPSIQTVWEQDGYFIFKVTPAPTFPRQASKAWPPWLQLEGYELGQATPAGGFVSGEMRPAAGHTLRVMLYWTALTPMEKNYSVSVRLLTPDGRLLAQDDSWPGRGALATSLWTVGRTIRDTHYIQLPSDSVPDALALAVMVYETDTVQPIAPADGYILRTW
jgi:uncharacterized membrane protein